MSSFAERLKEERERLRLTQTEFGSLGDSSKASQINYESGKRSPDSEYLTKIATAGVDISYLFTGLPGFAARYRDGPRITPPNLNRLSPGDLAFGDEEFVFVQRYDVNLSAGPGLVPVENAESEQLAFSRSWMSRNSLNNQLCGLVRVRGDSMFPTIPDGAMVLVHVAEMMVKKEGIYAFIRGGAAFVKRVIPINTGKDGRATSMVILSDNSAYAPDVLVGEALNEIRIVGRVRCAMTTF